MGCDVILWWLVLEHFKLNSNFDINNLDENDGWCIETRMDIIFLSKGANEKPIKHDWLTTIYVIVPQWLFPEWLLNNMMFYVYVSGKQTRRKQEKSVFRQFPKLD